MIAHYTALITTLTLPLLAYGLSIPEQLQSRHDSSPASPGNTLAYEELHECIKLTGIKHYFRAPASPEYCKAVTPFNLRFSWKPDTIAYPNDKEEVAEVVKCAFQTGIKVAAKSGGHSYAAYGLGGQDGSLVIDLVGLQGVKVDNSTKVATIGAGVRLGNVASQLFAQGERAMPHGTCPGVGIGGHALFGGFGLDSRLWGLALDMIIEMTAVLGNGDIVTVTEKENSDLFWALRGAGPSFAVVTEFKVNTLDAIKVNINWVYTWTLTDPAISANAFTTIQDWVMVSAPKEQGFGVVLAPHGAFTIRGVYYGSLKDHEENIQPLLNKLDEVTGGAKRKDTVNVFGWIDSLRDLAGGPLEVPVDFSSEHDTFFVKSLVTPESDPITPEALLNFFQYLLSEGEKPSYSTWFIIINLYGGPGSVINSFPASTDPASTSSYAHRSSLWVFQIYGNTGNNLPPYDDSIGPLVTGMRDAITTKMPGVTFAAYAPYIDPTLRPSEAYVQYYGDGYNRLNEIKSQVDPTFVFWNPQVVGLYEINN